MLFDLYNWHHNHETRDKIFGNLAEMGSDIMCFQEFYTSEEKGDFNNIDSLTKLLNLSNYHTEYTTTLREFDHWGIATFSRFPIVNKGKIIFNTKNNNLCIYTDLLIYKDTVRVYNLHLQSISFSKKDNQFLNDLKQGNDSDEDIEKSKNILRRLKRAFVKRAKQVEAIKLHMNTCKYKIILCGDFNDTPGSYAYNELCKKLTDAFVAKGNGFGRTYAGEWPQFRIDYILFDKQFHCSKFQKAEETFTDHFPITANLY
jgi:endonuclease/exonuclease/phosphatase family metal-dependent hydrolase